MTTASLRTARRAALRRLADDVLEAPDLPALTRLLTRELPETLGAESATLLLCDRKLESFQGVTLTGDGRLTTFGPRTTGPEAPRARWLVSEGQLLETTEGSGEGALVPLLARSGLAGTLVLGRAPRRRGPVSPGEAQAVSLIASRAALAIENNTYQKELIASERLAALGTMA
ncbi:MAG: hypothetical protein R3190_10580, partial [Thermoanaerobaculia bacterium]|nr:hypothetical protein [Thermoanaerobaculia bacterium]